MNTKQALELTIDTLEREELRNQAIISTFGKWMKRRELDELRAEQKELNKAIYEGYELMARNEAITKGVE